MSQQREDVTRDTFTRIPRHRVTSSNIESIGYHVPGQMLDVEFIKGGVYRYFQVPGHVAQDFEDAPSKGQFFASRIKGKYTYERLGSEHA